MPSSSRVRVVMITATTLTNKKLFQEITFPNLWWINCEFTRCQRNNFPRIQGWRIATLRYIFCYFYPRNSRPPSTITMILFSRIVNSDSLKIRDHPRPINFTIQRLRIPLCEMRRKWKVSLKMVQWSSRESNYRDIDVAIYLYFN